MGRRRAQGGAFGVLFAGFAAGRRKPMLELRNVYLESLQLLQRRRAMGVPRMRRGQVLRSTRVRRKQSLAVLHVERVPVWQRVSLRLGVTRARVGTGGRAARRDPPVFRGAPAHSPRRRPLTTSS